MASATNPFRRLLPELTPKNPLIPAEAFRGGVKGLDAEAIRLIRKAGVTSDMVRRSLEEDVQVSYDRWNLYSELERCLAGDTEIWLLNGTSPTIEEMANNPEKFVGKYTLSINPETLGLEPDKITSVRKTQTDAQLVRVHLDNDKYVTCTPEHRFMLRDGSYKEAQLLAFDRLMPFYTDVKDNQSQIIRHTETERLNEKQDVYDITTEKNHNFPVMAGIFLHNSMEHWFVGPAAILYANVATVFSPLQNCTVWVTAESEVYRQELSNLLDRIGTEEKILDWAHATGAYGDLFVKINGTPGIGVVSVDDGMHPMNLGRIDYEGILLGFYMCPQGQTKIGSDSGEDPQKLIPPWDYVHFRLLGARKKRPRFSDPGYTELRQIHLITGADTRQVTTRYGTSLLTNGLPAYKRLRLAEDSLLLARVTRGIIRYVWKLKVSAENSEAVSALMDQYATLITRARAIDTRENNGGPNYDSKQNPLTCLRGNTQIRLCDGRNVPIQEMAENPVKFIGKKVWTKNIITLCVEGKRILAAMKTRENAALLRIHFDNDKYVDCTQDHKFLLRDGTYKEAQYLQIGNNLMPSFASLITVTKIDMLPEREDVYDITVEDNHNFALSNGIFVHNCIEDIFVPIWGDMDLSQEKIGGEADIRWIVDIDSLRQQLAFSLATPLALGGAYVKEATGSLGSEAISKLDIRFARNARTLQRALIQGITRICQIHLAYMGMDPDPNLFEVHMTETSTAEEESLRKSLDIGMGTFIKLAASLRKIVGKKLDGEKLFNYYNEKVLRLIDFRLEDFYKSSEILKKESEAQRAAVAAKAELPAGEEEPKKPTPIMTSKGAIQEVKVRVRHRPIENLDICSYLPTTSEAILERCVGKISDAKGVTWIKERDQETWKGITEDMAVKIEETKKK